MDEFSHMQIVGRTRKAHQCFECRLEIVKGRKAIKRSGRFDGAFYSDYAHPDCNDAGMFYFQEARLDRGEGWHGLHEEMAYFGTTDPEFTDTLEMLRENGWPAVAERLMKGRDA